MRRNLIREARRRAGISQRELAHRLGTQQPVISRWESGRTSPGHETVERAVRACGFELEIALIPVDDHDLVLIKRELKLLPHERLSRMMKAMSAFDEMGKVAHG